MTSSHYSVENSPSHTPFHRQADDEDSPVTTYDSISHHRSKKQFRAASPDYDSSSHNTCNYSGNGSESEEVISSSPSPVSFQQQETFVPPPGLEERFQTLLTLQQMPLTAVASVEKEVQSVTQDEVDSLLYARDMYELSMEEREKVLMEIHGVVQAPIVDETPEFVSQKRKELSMALLVSKTGGTAAYSQALVQNASYVQSKDFQLPFLRCEQWDATAAAQKILDFFEIKLRLFGLSKLTKPAITVSDLSKEDKKALECGFFQLLPTRDVAGRAIIFCMPMCSQYGHVDNLVR